MAVFLQASLESGLCGPETEYSTNWANAVRFFGEAKEAYKTSLYVTEDLRARCCPKGPFKCEY